MPLRSTLKRNLNFSIKRILTQAYLFLKFKKFIDEKKVALLPGIAHFAMGYSNLLSPAPVCWVVLCFQERSCAMHNVQIQVSNPSTTTCHTQCTRIVTANHATAWLFFFIESFYYCCSNSFFGSNCVSTENLAWNQFVGQLSQVVVAAPFLWRSPALPGLCLGHLYPRARV